MLKEEVMAVEKTARRAQVLKRPAGRPAERNNLRVDGIFSAVDLLRAKAAEAFLSGEDVAANALRQASFEVENLAKS